MNKMDNDEFRDLLRYLGSGHVRDTDIPHRTKTSNLIMEAFETRFTMMLEDIKVRFHAHIK